MNNKHSQDYDPAQSHEAKPRMAGQLLRGQPVEIALQPGESLDIFTGHLSDMENANAADMRRFSVVDLRDAERNERGAIVYEGQEFNPNIAYLITQPGMRINWEGGVGYKGLRKGEVVDIGRMQDAVKERFQFPDIVSRHHFTVAVDNEGVLMLEDPGSLNGTSFQTSREEAVEELGLSPEEERRREYLHELFSLPDPQGRDRFGNDLDRRLKVTEQSEADAATAYRYADSDIKSIVSKHAREHYGAFREEDMAGILFEDEELRMKLGEHLLTKLDWPDIEARLPSRFFVPDHIDMKNPNHVGYPHKMRSHEYAAILALSMLDGTFKAPSEKGDPIESKYGEILSGQHRYAAMLLLGIQQSPLAKIKKLR